MATEFQTIVAESPDAFDHKCEKALKNGFISSGNMVIAMAVVDGDSFTKYAQQWMKVTQDAKKEPEMEMD